MRTVGSMPQNSKIKEGLKTCKIGLLFYLNLDWEVKIFRR